MNRRAIRSGVAVVVAGLFVVEGVHAAPPAPVPGGPKPRLVAHAFAHGGAFVAARSFARGVEASLTKDSRVAYVPMEAVLLDAAADDKALADADAKVGAARAKIEELDLAVATKLLKAAIAAYEKLLHRLAARPKPIEPLVDAYKLLTAARFIDGDQEGAREALRRARVLDPELAYDAKLFPPKMRRVFTEVKLLQDELGKGTVAVTSDPPGAEVLVNGVSAGIAPLKLPGLASGLNYITLLQPGYLPTTTSVEVVGGEEKKVDQALGRFDDDPAPLLERTRASLGELTLSSAMRDLARRLKADLLLLAFVREEGENVNLSLYLYDVRTGKLVRSVKKTVPRAEVEATAAIMATEIEPGTAAAVDLALTKPRAKKPNLVWAYAVKFRRWKYFWPTVAVTGALVLTAIILGVTVQPQAPFDPRWGVVLTTGRGPGWSF
ncbi:MAG: PEGA domain-containing protein [Deltaproteobacteria bacterium]|nr:PEGA domain-containing protein [Deltaproteobacteria bacterium]